MIENIMEIARGIVLIAGVFGIFIAIWISIAALVDSDGNFQCDMDCKHCPFPECSDEEKERMRKL